MTKCSVTNCANKRWARGLCSGHLARLKKGLSLDTPLATKRRFPDPAEFIDGVWRIPLDKGRCVLVDEQDTHLAKHFWYVHGKPGNEYAARKEARRTVLLHREITNVANDALVDHINGDAFDCRRANLRICSHAENTRNAKLSRANTSGFKGVYFHKPKNKKGSWAFTVRVNGKQVTKTGFESAAAADAARRPVIERLHANFANHGDGCVMGSRAAK
jgi:hypothetical protein